MRSNTFALLLAALSVSCTCSEQQREGNDAGLDTGTDSDVDIDSDTDADSDTDSDTDSDADTDSSTDTDVDADSDSGTDASVGCVLATEYPEQYLFSELYLEIGSQMAAADFDEDGILDFVFRQQYDNRVALAFGNGEEGISDGTWTSAWTYPTGALPQALTVSDFNEDDVVDIAVANIGDESVSILLGDGTDGVGDGTFAAAANYPAVNSPADVDVGDFDEDGILDLVILSGICSYPGFLVGVLFGNGLDGVGDGTFGPPIIYYPSVFYPSRLEIVDLDVDGVLDLIIASTLSDELCVMHGNGTDGVADGTFWMGPCFAVGDHPSAMVAADFNEDGIPDLAVANYFSDDIRILIGTGVYGEDAFDDPVVYPVGDLPEELTSADLDNDGILDLAVSNQLSSDTVGVLAGCGEDGVGDGTFGEMVEYPVPEWPGSLVAADFDEDGLLDLATPNDGSDSITILYGAWAE